MKIFSKNPHDRLNKVTFPFVGEVTFDENGSFEHDDEDACYELLEACSGRLSLSSDEAEKSASPETSTPAGRLAELQKMRMSDLKEIAKEFPEEEWKALKKDDLVIYIADKLNAAAEEKKDQE